MNRNETYINQILVAINKIDNYTQNGKFDFFDLEIIQDAVIRNIEIIGEVTKRV